MIKVLHYGLSMEPGGIENYLLKLWNQIDRKQYEFIFVDLYKGKAYFRKNLEREGCLFYNITHRRDSIIRNYKDWKQLFSERDVDIVHCHLNTLSDLMPVFMGLRYGKKIIVHSRNSQMTKSPLSAFLHKVNSILLPRKKITMVAVSKKAGDWLFGKNSNFQIINNGVDLGRFHYDDRKRDYLRNKFDLQDKWVLGHVGVFLPVKNHIFLLKMFQAVWEKVQNARLVLIGDGPLKTQMEILAKEMGIQEYVIFLGRRSDVADWYSVMDMLVFPSLFEGFPNVVLEAQATGLPCIISDNITDEVVRFPICKKMSPDGDAREWASQILKNPLVEDRASYADQIAQQGYDTSHEIMKIEQLYNSCMSFHKS